MKLILPVRATKDLLPFTLQSWGEYFGQGSNSISISFIEKGLIINLHIKVTFLHFLLKQCMIPLILQKVNHFFITIFYLRRSVVLKQGVTTHLCVASFLPSVLGLFLDIILRKIIQIWYLKLKIMVFCLKNVSPRNNFTKNVSPTKKGWEPLA
jgi:hypothetical protein